MLLKLQVVSEKVRLHEELKQEFRRIVKSGA